MTFWKTLFDADEQTCFASTLYGTAVCKVTTGAHLGGQFFSINPLQANRKDSNVTKFRNVLIEFDGMATTNQMELIKAIPYSTLVWSGGKSYHAIVSLEEPCTNRREYDALVRRIYAALPGVDPANKNPSRFSRIPGVMRDNGNLQELVDVVCRRSSSELDKWLGPAPAVEPDTVHRQSLGISPFTKHFLAFGVEEGGRNAALFKAACDMLRHGYSTDEIFKRACLVLDLPELEIWSCIRSAQMTVKNH